MSALDQAVRSGKALYAGISSYNPEQTATAVKVLREMGTPCLIHQPKYSMFERSIEGGLLDVLGKEGVGGIAFCPLAQGLLTDRYLKGIPEGSRASKPYSFLKKNDIDEHRLTQIGALNEIAAEREQSLAQMALAWVLRDGRMTSALIGASRVEQIEQNVAALANLAFSTEELARIDAILAQV
jgi:L-glyceraldehyde 3-phosphate reductase